MRNTLIIALLLALGLPLAACVSAGVNDDGSAFGVSVSPLVGLDRLQKSERAIAERLNTNTEAIKTVVTAEVAAGLDVAKKDFEQTQTEIAEEDGKNRQWVYLGLGLLGLGGLGFVEKKRRGKVAIKKADEKVADRDALVAGLAKAVAGNKPSTEAVSS